MIYVLLGTGFEETEAIAPIDLLRRAGIDVLTVGIQGKLVYGGHGIGVAADITLEEMDLTVLDMIVLPGGLGGVKSVKESPAALEAVRFAWENGKYVAAICAAPTILAQLGITDGLDAVCYPGCEAEMGQANMVTAPCVQSGRVITGTSAGCAVAFGLKMIEVLKGKAEADRIANQIVIL